MFRLRVLNSQEIDLPKKALPPINVPPNPLGDLQANERFCLKLNVDDV